MSQLKEVEIIANIEEEEKEKYLERFSLRFFKFSFGNYEIPLIPSLSSKRSKKCEIPSLSNKNSKKSEEET